MGRKIPGIRSMVVAREGKQNALSVLLRASEGISHSRWDASTKGFKNRFKVDGETWINFAKNAAGAFADVARGITNEPDFSAFPFLADTGERKKDPAPPTPPTPPTPPPTPTPAPRVEPVRGGFSVTMPPRSVPCTLEIMAAYDVSTGNPFGGWRPADFKFEKLTVRVSGGKLIAGTGNVLTVEVSRPDDFSLTAVGFDGNRDLVVTAEPTRNDAGADDE